MKRILIFIKKETVLVVAILLAVISIIFIPPDQQYPEYIDFRTLGILFGLMTCVAGVQQLGVFDRLAGMLLRKVSGRMAITSVLVMLCFFSSMLLTNDVALITFVPFSLILLQRKKELFDEKWILRIVVMQTIAANLGSMLTPIGNPQNLYLFGLAQMRIEKFILLMLPYSVMAFLVLITWIILASGISRIYARNDQKQDQTTIKNIQDNKITFSKEDGRHQLSEEKHSEKSISFSWKLWCYCVLFLLGLFVVGRVLPWSVFTVFVLVFTFAADRKTLMKVDYSLLGTFAALFIFIGNLGRIEVFRQFLERMIRGREMVTSVLASQVMSNVPAAILLSGFTDAIPNLIVGTNIGGLGTLIASMASLISFKYIAREYPAQKGRYFCMFTLANVFFLLVMLIVYLVFLSPVFVKTKQFVLAF
ncbi:SLC13 family permease [Jutongia huaianensis]|uniref:Citrate transporter n=1 Tax=Jutongia huaianensis TaxID=2763668 RepID=A0ABR7N1V3_9FIRM|nr:SLC13 family permease [Jutongia huaianensis]MBC8562604.1 citrate transporter [Jutongia huaianensis]